MQRPVDKVMALVKAQADEVEQTLLDHRTVEEIVRPLEELADLIPLGLDLIFKADSRATEHVERGEFSPQQMESADRGTLESIERMLTICDRYERFCKIAAAHYDLSAELAKVQAVRQRLTQYRDAFGRLTPEERRTFDETERAVRGVFE